MNENKDIKKSLKDLKSPSLGTSKEPLVSKPELAELKTALDTHISTVVEKDKARLAEQQKHEGQLTLLRSELNKKQTKLQEHENRLSLLREKLTKVELDIGPWVNIELDDDKRARMFPWLHRSNNKRSKLEEYGRLVRSYLTEAQSGNLIYQVSYLQKSVKSLKLRNH